MSGEEERVGRPLGRRFWLVLGAILLFALALRAVVVVGASRDRIAGDPAFYDEVGVSVAAGRGRPRVSRRREMPEGRPTALHPPAWPYVLAATYAATGHDTRLDRRRSWLAARDPGRRRAALSVANARWRAARVVNALLGIAAVALIGLIATAVWGPTVGLVGAGWPRSTRPRSRWVRRCTPSRCSWLSSWSR